MHSMHIRVTESIKANTLHMLNSTKCMPLNDNDDCTHRVLCVCSSAGNEFSILHNTHDFTWSTFNARNIMHLMHRSRQKSKWWESREKSGQAQWSAFDETGKLNLIKFGALRYASLHGIKHYHGARRSTEFLDWMIVHYTRICMVLYVLCFGDLVKLHSPFFAFHAFASAFKCWWHQA